MELGGRLKEEMKTARVMNEWMDGYSYRISE